MALDDTLKALAEVDAKKSKLVELRFFGGMSVEQTGKVLKVSQDTVMRDWRWPRRGCGGHCQRQVTSDRGEQPTLSDRRLAVP